MEFNEFTQALEAWCQSGHEANLACWVDGAQFQITLLGNGLRCSLEVFEGWHPEQLKALLSEAGAGVACGCRGALAFDPHAYVLLLVEWCPLPVEPPQILKCLEGLANQRAAMLSLADARELNSFTVSNL